VGSGPLERPEGETAVIICVSANPSLDQILVTDGFDLGGLGGKVEPVRWSVVPGGSGVRIAHVAHQMGAPVIATGFRGGGAGAWHARLMDQAGFAHDFVEIEGETRGTVLILDETEGLLVELPGPAPTVTEDDVRRLEEKVDTLSGEGDWMVLSGKLPFGAPVDLYARLTEIAHGRGARVALDARGETLRNALERVPEVWKPNAAEMKDTMSSGLDPVAQCERGTSILLSEGKFGALLLRAGQRPRRFAPPVRHPWNPAGSGNSLLAATIAVLHDGGDWDEAIRRGLAAGVANMRHDIAGYVTPAEVLDLAGQVVIREETS